jgi:hypothetical protein
VNVFHGGCQQWIGYALQGGECQQIWGCRIPGMNLFESMDACMAACLP